MMSVVYSIDFCHFDNVNFRFTTAPFANKSAQKYQAHFQRPILIGRLGNDSQWHRSFLKCLGRIYQCNMRRDFAGRGYFGPHMKYVRGIGRTPYPPTFFFTNSRESQKWPPGQPDPRKNHTPGSIIMNKILKVCTK